MHKFKYRAPRYPVDLPVSLAMEGSIFSGRCREISLDGMRLEVAEPLPARATGTISLDHRHIALEVRVCVIRAGDRQDGLRFCFDSEKQRALMAELVGLLSKTSVRQGPVLVR